MTRRQFTVITWCGAAAIIALAGPPAVRENEKQAEVTVVGGQIERDAQLHAHPVADAMGTYEDGAATAGA